MVEIAPVIASALVFMIPIIAILTHHQRKMAEIVHNRQTESAPLPILEEIQRLRSEVAQLREVVHQQAIVLDGPARPPSVADRLSAVENA